MRLAALGLVAACAVCAFAPASAEPVPQGFTQPGEFSAQSRRERRTRVTVRPRRDSGERPLFTSDRRECRATFEERNIPQWGGKVLYAGQERRWVR